jgi:phage shock protein C
MREPLYRSRTDRILLGVAGGVADWLDVDPSVVRLVWVLLVLAGGAGVLLYIVAAIVVPEEPLEAVAAQASSIAAQAPSAAADATTVNATAPAASTLASSANPASVRGASPFAAPVSRQEARQARRAARQAARVERGGSGGSAGAALGIILVLIGGLLLLQNLVPDLDMRLVGPTFLVVIGLVLVVSALGRRPGPPRP